MAIREVDQNWKFVQHKFVKRKLELDTRNGKFAGAVPFVS